MLPPVTVTQLGISRLPRAQALHSGAGTYFGHSGSVWFPCTRYSALHHQRSYEERLWPPVPSCPTKHAALVSNKLRSPGSPAATARDQDSVWTWPTCSAVAFISCSSFSAAEGALLISACSFRCDCSELGPSSTADILPASSSGLAAWAASSAAAEGCSAASFCVAATLAGSCTSGAACRKSAASIGRRASAKLLSSSCISPDLHLQYARQAL